MRSASQFDNSSRTLRDMSEPVITLHYWINEQRVGVANHGLSDGLKRASEWLEQCLAEFGHGRIEVRIGVQDVGAETVWGRTVSAPANTTYTLNVVPMPTRSGRL